MASAFYSPKHSIYSYFGGLDSEIAIMSKKKLFALIVLTALIAAFATYKYMVPNGPVLDEVPNTIQDRATKNWEELESKLPTNPLRNAYFGDLHAHTNYSFDAYIGGVTGNPDDAYRFAKGEAIEVLGEKVTIQRRLDFAAVTDHSEYLGEMYTAQHKGAPGNHTLAARYFRAVRTDTIKQRALFHRLRQMRALGGNHPKFFRGFTTTAMAWDKEIEAAEKHYEPGKFTTFAAYEWTLGGATAHIHRNVFFGDMKVPNYPVSAFEATNEAQLWQSLEQFRKQGATVMAIPHNSNLSHGFTFPLTQTDSSEIDVSYAQTRAKNEPLVEIHQAKGNSEVHPALWQNDEYADFEIYEDSSPNQNNYVRHILKRGLEYEEKFDANPYKYGIIGSTDTHNATPGNAEEGDNYLGNHLMVDSKATTRANREWILNPKLRVYEAMNPGGLVGIWAEANTRSHLYDAMLRKETFATSGTCILMRFFAGYGFKDSYEDYDDMLRNGYEKGVPMGGDIVSQNDDSPEFLIWAAKDPLGRNLHKVQVIKGWYDGERLHEKIYDAVLAENHASIDESIVNRQTGRVAEGIGSATLFTVWNDPDFNPQINAFYYLRILEIPSPRYTLWDEIKYGVKYPEETKRIIQERAWSSPIWYKPDKRN